VLYIRFVINQFIIDILGYPTSTGPKDDDVMSVTSREVAEILSMAAPMAPLSDEEQEQEEDSRADLDDEDDDYYYNNSNNNGAAERYVDDGSSGRRGTTTSTHSDVYVQHQVSSAFQRLTVDGGLQQYRPHDALVVDRSADRPWVGGRPSSIHQTNSDIRNGTASRQPTGRIHSNGDVVCRPENDYKELNSSTSGNGSARAPGTTTTAPGAAAASLFRLIRTCRLGAFRLERRRDQVKSSSAPFQVCISRRSVRCLVGDSCLISRTQHRTRDRNTEMSARSASDW